VTEPEPVVEVRDTHYRIGARAIFNGVNIRVPRGSITAVMGLSRARGFSRTFSLP
jgi:phospholipid/cholesterol/gamma-HCH transport system ATP-binding protein